MCQNPCKCRAKQALLYVWRVGANCIKFKIRENDENSSLMTNYQHSLFLLAQLDYA
jgi:hypothetical protein